MSKAYQVDPENIELRTLLALAGDLSAKRVLEVGCGSGRLTELYADYAKEIVAIDPNEERIAAAGQKQFALDANHVRFKTADILEFQHPDPFDLVLLAWAL